LSKLSTLQRTTFHKFRSQHCGVVGVVLEDDQGFEAFVEYVTGITISGRESIEKLECQRIAKCLRAHGFLDPDTMSLDQIVQDF
jgi:gamma-glutamylcysteine synthetase